MLSQWFASGQARHADKMSFLNYFLYKMKNNMLLYVYAIIHVIICINACIGKVLTAGHGKYNWYTPEEKVAIGKCAAENSPTHAAKYASQGS